MEDPHAPIARYLRERRESSGLTRAALSEAAGISPALIQKIEQGTRVPTLEALTALFDALDVPDVFRNHLVALSLSHRYDEPAPTQLNDLPAADLVLLHSLPHPASVQVYPTFDVLAVNAAWERFFPGLVPGTTLLEWMLLDPISRTVVIEWAKQIHLSVYGFRVMSPGVVPQQRIDELVAACSAAPEWEHLWTTEPQQPHDIDSPVLTLRDPGTGAPTSMSMLNFEFAHPRREWSLITFCPATEEI